MTLPADRISDPQAAPPWRLLLLVMAVTGVGQLAFASIPPVLPELADALGVSRGAIGLVYGAVALPGVFLAAYVGYLTDRFGRRAVVRASLAVFGAAGTACFFAGDYWLLLGLRLVQGLGTSTLLSIGVVIIGDQFGGYRRRWAMGLNMAALTAVATLAPIVGGFLGDGGTFRPFLLYLLAFPVWVAARRLPEPAGTVPPAPPLAHLHQALADLRRRRRLTDFLGVLPMSLVTLALYLGLAQAVTPLFLDREFSLSASRRGLVQAVASAASSTASVMSGRVGNRFRPAQVISVGFVLMAAGFACIGVAPTLWAVAAGLALLGSAAGSMFPLLQGFSTSAGPARYRGVLVGTWVTANRLGQFGGPAAGTALAGAIGDRQSYLLGAVVMAGMAALWVPLRRLAASRAH